MSVKDYLAVNSLMNLYLDEWEKYRNAECRVFEIDELLFEAKGFEEFNRLAEEKRKLDEYVTSQKAFCEGIRAARDRMIDFFGLCE